MFNSDCTWHRVRLGIWRGETQNTCVCVCPRLSQIACRWTSLSYKSVMMTSSNGNIFRVTGPLCGEFTGHRWIPRTKASDAELWCFLWSALWINGWVNNRDAGDLRRNRTYYDVIVILFVLVKTVTRVLCQKPSHPEQLQQMHTNIHSVKLI